MRTRRGSSTVVGMKMAASADREYKNRSGRVHHLLKELEKAMKDHDARQKKEPSNWGFAGNLGHVESELGDVLRFIRS